jgi:hypothetical protein
MNLTYVLYGNNDENLIKQIKSVDPTVRHQVTITPHKSKRTLEQNKWVRKFAAEFGKQFGYDPDEAYDLLMYKCNASYVTDKFTGEEIRLPGHFSKHKTDTGAEVQERMIQFGIGIGFYFDET